MRILFDQGTPVSLRRYFHPHSVDTVFERGWSTLGNGDLLETAIREGYDVFVTTDQNLKHQQNLAEVHLGIVVLLSTSWPRIRSRVEDIIIALEAATGGSLVEVPSMRTGKIIRSNLVTSCSQLLEALSILGS